MKLECPTCNSKEMHPEEPKLLIRGYKVFDEGCWWSQCLVCAGFYDEALNYDMARGNPNGGWFAS